MPDDPYLVPRDLADVVHSIASRAGLSPDVADDYLRTPQVESGHNVNVRNSSKGAIGFGQVMPDVKCGTVRTVGGRRYDLKDPSQNIEAGLRYFAEGGDDPIARRLYYFGGPGARQRYERTGKIPNISDGNMTAAQYVRATGGYQQSQQDPYLTAKPSTQSSQSTTPVDDPYLVAKPSGQTLPPQTTEQRQLSPNIPSSPVTPAPAKSVPSIADAIPQGLLLPPGQRNLGAAYKPKHAMNIPASQVQASGEIQQQHEREIRQQVEQEVKSRYGPYGSPTLTGALHLAANPSSAITNIFKPIDQQIDEETQARLKAEQVAQEPEVTSIRKEYGAMPAAVRAPLSAVIGTGGGGMLHFASGLARLGGALPKGVIPPLDQLSDWAKKRAEIIETGAAMSPLSEERLGSSITGQPEFREVERGIPEKVLKGVSDLGVGLGEVLLLKKATNLSFPQLLGLEAALKNSDKPLSQQASATAEGYALGKVLDSHLSRTASAALFGAPTAAQTGYEVAQGRMSPLDAAIQTGVQTVAGAALGGRGEPASRPTEFTVGSRWRNPQWGVEGEPATVISNNGKQVVIERGGRRLETTLEALRQSVQNGTLASVTSEQNANESQSRPVETGPDTLPPDFIQRNQSILNDPDFRNHLRAESIGGNAGEGGAAVHVVLDPDGRIVRYGNEPVQELPPLVQERLRTGDYSQASLVFKDALSDNPQPESLVPHDQPATGPGDVQSKWFVDLED